MKKFKLFIWFIIALCIAVFIFSNQEFFTDKQAYTLNLLFKEYNLGEVKNWILFVSCFVAGIILAYVFSFPVRMRLRKEIKTLNAANNTHLEMIASLKKELEGLKGQAGEAAVAAMQSTPSADAAGSAAEGAPQAAETVAPESETQPQEKA
jgi:uncharacterized integral membrane protein